MVRVLWRSDKDKIAFKVTEKHRYGLPKTVSKYLKIWKTKTTTIKKNVIVAVTRSHVRQRVLEYSLLLPSNILSDWIEKQITSCPKLGFSFEIAWLKSFCLKAPISFFHNVCFYCTTEKYTLNELLLIYPNVLNYSIVMIGLRFHVADYSWSNFFFFFGGFLIICDSPEDFEAQGDRTCNTLTQHVKPREAREARGAEKLKTLPNRKTQNKKQLRTFLASWQCV